MRARTDNVEFTGDTSKFDAAVGRVTSRMDKVGRSAKRVRAAFAGIATVGGCCR